MRACWLGRVFGGITLAIVAALPVGEAAAQRHHHHHDAAGHMIDHAGHHIDAYGRHTGAVGVYHNQYGQYIYQQPTYAQGYVNRSPGYVSGGSPYSAVVPQNVIPYSASANPARFANGGPIRIYNPDDSGGEVSYSLNGSSFTIKPGSTQTVQYDRVWTVEFGSGGSAGNIRYSLETGTYKFKVTETGWNLFKTQDQPSVAVVPPPPIPKLDSTANEPRPGIVPVD